MPAGAHAEEHRWGLTGFDEDASHGSAEDALESEGHSPGPASDSARQIDGEWILLIDGHSGRGELALESQRCHRVSGEQAHRVLIVDELRVRSGFRRGAAGLDGFDEVAGVFDDVDSVVAQHRLLPFAGIGGHMHRGGEPEASAEDPDRQSEVAGRADDDAVVRGDLTELWARIGGGIHCVEAMVGGDRLGEFEHLVEAAAGLDRSADRQGVVAFEPQPSGDFGSEQINEAPLRRGCRDERRFDHSAAGLGERLGELGRDGRRLREGRREPGCEAVEPGCRGIHDRAEVGQGRLGGGGAKPRGRSARCQGSDDLVGAEFVRQCGHAPIVARWGAGLSS